MALDLFDWIFLDRKERQMLRHFDRMQEESSGKYMSENERIERARMAKEQREAMIAYYSRHTGRRLVKTFISVALVVFGVIYTGFSIDCWSKQQDELKLFVDMQKQDISELRKLFFEKAALYGEVEISRYKSDIFSDDNLLFIKANKGNEDTFDFLKRGFESAKNVLTDFHFEEKEALKRYQQKYVWRFDMDKKAGSGKFARAVFLRQKLGIKKPDSVDFSDLPEPVVVTEIKEQPQKKVESKNVGDKKKVVSDYETTENNSDDGFMQMEYLTYLDYEGSSNMPERFKHMPSGLSYEEFCEWY